jgi:hypothetical protein
MSPFAVPLIGVPEEVNTTAAPAAGYIARPPGRCERITVLLIPSAATGLWRLRARTNLSKTDIANRAIQSYEFLDAQMRSGNDLIVRNRRTGRTRLVRGL